MAQHIQTQREALHIENKRLLRGAADLAAINARLLEENRNLLKEITADPNTRLFADIVELRSSLAAKRAEILQTQLVRMDDLRGISAVCGNIVSIVEAERGSTPEMDRLLAKLAPNIAQVRAIKSASDNNWSRLTASTSGAAPRGSGLNQQ